MKVADKNYKTTKYAVTIRVEKPRSWIFYHLLNNVDKFWPEDFKGQSAQLNDEFEFSSGGNHYSKNKVHELVPDSKLVWLVTESIRKDDNFDWSGTKMIFELAEEGQNTLLTFTYDGLVFEDEYDRLVMICDKVIGEILFNYLTESGNI